MQITAASGGNISPVDSAEATISDDDPAPVLVSISGSPNEEEGDSLSFEVSLDMTPTRPVSVSFRVADVYYQGHPLYLWDGPYCGWQPTTDYEEPSSTTLTWAPGDYPVPRHKHPDLRRQHRRAGQNADSRAAHCVGCRDRCRVGVGNDHRQRRPQPVSDGHRPDVLRQQPDGGRGRRARVRCDVHAAGQQLGGAL